MYIYIQIYIYIHKQKKKYIYIYILIQIHGYMYICTCRWSTFQLAFDWIIDRELRCRQLAHPRWWLLAPLVCEWTASTPSQGQPSFSTRKIFKHLMSGRRLMWLFCMYRHIYMYIHRYKYISKITHIYIYIHIATSQ